MEATAEHILLSNLLQDFTSIPNIEKAWTFSNLGTPKVSQAMFSVTQSSLKANKRRQFMLSSVITKQNTESVTFEWSPFPIETISPSIIVPSPSGSKLLIMQNPQNDSPTQFQIWTQSHLEKEIHVPRTIHGPVYTDGWFDGVAWNSNETHIVYVAERPAPPKPVFSPGDWKGQGDWEETYPGKRLPSLFLIDTNSGEVKAVKGVPESMSVGQVVWSPLTDGVHQYLVFAGWSWLPNKRKMLGYNRPSSLYAVRVSLHSSDDGDKDLDDTGLVNLTSSINSAIFPRFSRDGKFLVFLCASCAVDSGVHTGTLSLHKIDWLSDGKLSPSENISTVIPVVQCAEEGCFPGLYTSSPLSDPWLSDGHTMILSSSWGSCKVIISVDVLSGKLLCISPSKSNFSWDLITLDGDNIIAVSSSPVDVPQIKYGCLVQKDTWSWLNVASPILRCSEKVLSSLTSLQFSILKIPVKDTAADLTRGAKKPFEAIFISSKSMRNGACNPLIVLLHGGPHSVWTTNFSRTSAFLCSIGYSLLIVNYRGSLGFGEEALQSLPGRAGSQDIDDVLTAIDHVINMGLASPSKLTAFGGSHGGFQVAHLLGQAPDKFAAAAVRNPVCNLALFVGTSDLPDWGYVECFGSIGKQVFTEPPSAEHLTLLHKSPIAHISKAKTPTLFLLGAQDYRVPFCNGLQYARGLKEKGVETKVIVFDDGHAIDRPQCEFESYLNIGLWFNKYCK